MMSKRHLQVTINTTHRVKKCQACVAQHAAVETASYQVSQQLLGRGVHRARLRPAKGEPTCQKIAWFVGLGMKSRFTLCTVADQL
jgi:hypothetical protein